MDTLDLPVRIIAWTYADYDAGGCITLPSLHYFWKGKEQRLHFRSIKDREKYYQSVLRHNSNAKKFSKYSELSKR